MVIVAVSMFCLAFFSFPLYTLFCRVTGYGGTPKTGEAAKELVSSVHLGKRDFHVRFNADTAKDLPWKFVPVQDMVDVRSGESKLIFYTAENVSKKPITGVATFNVTPELAAKYFNKVQCFCFTNQTLEPGEKVDMPVSFFIDPRIEDDVELKNLKTLTLSYTFFVAEE